MLVEETAGELREKENHKGIIEWLGKNKSLKNIAFLITFLTSVEGFAQGKSELESSIESSRKAIVKIEEKVKANSDRKGTIRILGFGQSEFFEKNIDNKKIHTNDDYIYIKETGPSMQGDFVLTKYGVDVGKDGVIDQIVLIPGEVTSDEEAMIVADFGNTNQKNLAAEADLASIERGAKGNTAALNRIVYWQNPASKEWIEVNFGDGSVKQLEQTKGETLQRWWEAKSTITAAELNQ